MPKQEKLDFNGPTRTLDLDGKRLGAQLATVLHVLRVSAGRNKWRTFEEIALLGGLRPTQAASISARIRELRAKGWVVDKRRRGDPKDGLWEYFMSFEPPAKQEAA